MAKKLAFDKVLFTVVVLLVGLGLAMVFSASAAIARDAGHRLNPFLVKQAMAALLGGGAMVAAMHFDYRRLRHPAVVYGLFGLCVVLLVAVLFSPEVNGSRRWFFLGPLSFQPSELAKLSLVLFLAYQVERRTGRAGGVRTGVARGGSALGRSGELPPPGSPPRVATGHGRRPLVRRTRPLADPRAAGRPGRPRDLVVPCAVGVTLLAGLVLVGRDLGTSLLLAGVAALVLLLAGIPWRFLIGGGVAFLPLLWFLIISVPYRRERLFAFLEPEKDPLGSGFQTLQSLIAVGSGGVFGLGPGESVQKLHFLPYPYSDFIFAIVAEELGLIGALSLLALFGLFLWRGARAGLRAPERFGRHLAWGLTGMIVLQALLNLSVATALLPTTGIPLPFISYGGSSMVTTLTACGVLLNLSQHG